MIVLRTANVKLIITSLLLGTLVSMAAVSSSWAKKDELPEVDKDGLHLVKKSKVRVAYVLPGATLSQYTKVKLEPTYVAFKPNYERDYNMNTIGLQGRVTNMDLEQIKTGLAAAFTKEFTKMLTKKGYPVVDEVGPDVLLLRPAILNLDVTAPDTFDSGFNTTIVRSAGEMTLYMEMYDSATNKLIARIVDPEADNEGFAERANSGTNRMAADLIISRWAALLVKRLDESKKHKVE